MNTAEFISSEQASESCGVSDRTLERFAEAGYLKTQTDSNGNKLFAAEDLQSVFGIRNSHKKTDSENIVDMQAHRKKEHVMIQDVEEKIIQSTDSKNTERKTGEEALEDEDLVSFEDNFESSDNGECLEESETPEEEYTEESWDEEIYALEAEIDKLKRVIEMQEQIFEIKEDEIKNLTKDRDWLRQRIEKLEQKSERDQVLLLAETQTIRQLVDDVQKSRKSPLRHALDWMGFHSDTNDSSNK